ncbi:type II secretion system F family protein [Anaerobium acetethylicum]|uniref:type II secretion system F family protein n=1 Tax=Anaerobium acetethylicum TaxID=1619234 RepID=UPI002E8E4E1D|nr:type II secretion system F family protein [Anaerobium acetethylicum]
MRMTEYGVQCSMAFLSLQAYFIIYCITERVDRISCMTKEMLRKSMAASRVNYFNYDRIALYLSRHGAEFMLNARADPVAFILVKTVLAAFLAVIGFMEGNVLLTVLLAVAGFFAADLILKVSNDSDNERMLNDIKQIYDTLKIQTRAGVFLTESLTECYLTVKSRRLKSALLELNNQIIMKKDIESAIDMFNIRFKNSYIDTFCIVIRQSLKSGKSIQILEDLSTQVTDIQQAVARKEKARLEGKIEVLQLLVFIGVLAVCMYSLAIELGGALLGF